MWGGNERRSAKDLDVKKLGLPTLLEAGLGNRKQEDRRQNNDRSGPETGRHFVHVAKENKGHQDAINRLKVGNKRHPECRKFAHYRYPGHIRQRGADSAQKQ